MSAFVRYRGSPSARVLVEPVGGVTLAFGSGTLAYGFVPDGSGQSDYPWEEDLTRRALGFGGGLDLMVPIGRRAAVGGMVRLHRLVWNEEHGLDVPNLGIGRWIFQAGATVSVALTAPRLEARSPSPAPADGGGQPRGYIGGFGALFIQPVGEVDGHYLTEGVGGHGFGFGGTAGAFIRPKWSVAAEVAVGPELEAESSFAGRIRYDTRYRDTLISGLFRWHSAPSARVHWEPVFGVTAAAAHVPRTETWVNWSGGPETVNDATIDRISFGVVGGADVVVGRRVAGVASVHVHLLDRRDSTDDQPPELGVGRFVYIVGGGIRFTF